MVESKAYYFYKYRSNLVLKNTIFHFCGWYILLVVYSDCQRINFIKTNIL